MVRRETKGLSSEDEEDDETQICCAMKWPFPSLVVTTVGRPQHHRPKSNLRAKASTKSKIKGSESMKFMASRFKKCSFEGDGKVENPGSMASIVIYKSKVPAGKKQRLQKYLSHTTD
ncbi:hypothetical protein AAHA92_24893 [Salvia divinorum]|uniref:Uncharacterized protein n=1 Tax=Salvia divinorum TaxID=28513 RepID=A0ABD1G8U2_SALDI